MKSFFKSIIFCQTEIWNLNKLLFILYYSVIIIRGLNPFFWSLAAKNLIDAATKFTTSHYFNINEIFPFFIIISIWTLLVLYTNTFFRYYDDKISRDYTLRFKDKLTNKLNSLDIQTFESSKFLDVLSNTDKNHEKVMIIFRESSNLVRDIVQSILAMVVLFTLNIFLPFIILIIVVSDIFYRNKFNKKYRDIDKEMSSKKRLEGHYYGLFMNKTSLEEMRLYNLSNFFQSKYKELNISIKSRLLEFMKSKLYIFTLLTFFDVLVVDIGSRLYAFFQIIAGRITIGEFSFYLNQIGSFSNSIHNFGFSMNAVFREMLDLEYYFDLEKFTPVLDRTLSNKSFNSESIEIEFKNVCFSYPGNEENKVFDNFNLKINASERIAIVGLNGAGKTTLIKLLLRYYDPDIGEILINGTNLKEIKIEDWYTKVGVLFQDFMKYEVSVKDNVGYGRIDNINNLKDIERALEKSSADIFVKTYNNGIDQILGKQFDESIQPSGGQWQKIALARAFFRNAPLLILDEPTAAIDAKSEAEIFENVEKLSSDKTVIIISHRFSTVRNADKIIVIENGKIIESGNHYNLIQKNGRYKELFELQAQGYK